jgi:glycosyltransferase involved in cell wall biosynthesis
MKIALYIASWPPGEKASGAVTYASQLVPALRKQGHEVFILTFRKNADDSDPRTMDLRRFVNRTWWNRATLRLAPTRASFKQTANAIASALCELMDKHGLDVFEIEEAFGFSHAIARMHLLPVVVRLHGPWHLNGRFMDPSALAANRRRVKCEGNGMNCAQLVTTPSERVLELTRNYYGFDLTASRVIRNPIEAAAEHETWNIRTCTNNTMLFVGRFDTLKGGDLVLRTFAELAALYPRLRLTFVGPDIGLNSVNGHLLSFHQFVQSSLPDWCHKRIDFRGIMNRTNIIQLRREHLVTVVASQQEVMPYSILEAMSLGCPLVATEVGGVPEVITDRRNGLLVPSQDVKAMTAACQMLLNDHALAARLGRQAWQDCGEFYRPDNIARQTLAAYEQAINNFRLRNTC